MVPRTSKQVDSSGIHSSKHCLHCNYSKFMHLPKKRHLEPIIRMFRYLKNTLGRGLFFKKKENRMVEVYMDAD